MKKKLAFAIRILTIPPIMVTALLATIYLRAKDDSVSAAEFLILLALLGIFPVLAYPVQWISPRLRKTGRDGQRKMAFVFTLLGYTAAMLWSVISHHNAMIRTISMSYFTGVVILTALNKLAHFKASGHACSFAASVELLIYFTDWYFIVPGLLLAFGVCWSSLYLKRHTPSQLAGGMLTALAAFGITILLI